MESVDILKRNKIKVTTGRQRILDIIMESDTALSADYIYNECVKHDKTINLSTVYRTLELLYERHIVDKINLGDGKYSFVYKRDSHKHLIECSLCHKEIEVDCPMKQIEEIIKTRTGFVMMEHNLSMKGICDKCKKEENQD